MGIYTHILLSASTILINIKIPREIGVRGSRPRSSISGIARLVWEFRAPAETERKPSEVFRALGEENRWLRAGLLGRLQAAKIHYLQRGRCPRWGAWTRISLLEAHALSLGLGRTLRKNEAFC